MLGTANGAGAAQESTPEVTQRLEAFADQYPDCDFWLILMGWADLEVEATLRGRIEGSARPVFETPL
jgi:hypothetical protein